MARLSEPRVTASEAVAVLRRLEPRLARDLTERRFRYAAQGSGAPKLGKGWTALYEMADVALVRLLLRVEASGLSEWVTRFAIGYLAGELRAALAHDGEWRQLVLSVPPVEGYPRRTWPRLVRVSEASQAGVVIPLRDVVTGVREAMRAVAAEQQTVTVFRPAARSTATTRVLERMEELSGVGV